MCLGRQNSQPAQPCILRSSTSSSTCGCQVHVPQVQYVDEFVDVPVQKQRRVAMAAPPQIVHKHVHVPMVQKVQKTVEVPQAGERMQMLRAMQ